MHIDLKKYGLKKDTVLTYDILEKHEDLEKEVISCVQRMFIESQTYMSKKVTDRLWLDEQERNSIRDGKIKSQDMLQARKMYAANFAREGLYPQFEGIEYSDVDLASDLTKIAKSDQDKMRLAVRFKQLTDNIFNYGSGIIIEDYVDHVSKCVVPKILSPLSYYPDPLGNYVDNNFRYHLFGTVTTKAELHAINDRLEQEGEECMYHEIDNLIGGTNYEDQYKARKNKNIRDYSMPSSGSSDEIYLTQGYIQINGLKYQIVLGNANNEIVRFDKLEPLTKEEKKDETSIPFPVAIVTAYPIDNDIMGVSPRELMFDFARAINKIVNAVYKKEMRNAGDDIYFVDPSLNLASLANKSDGGPIFLPHTNMERIPNPMVKAGEFADTSNSMLFYERLKKRGQENTGITDIKMGNPDQNNTLGQMEQQLTQSDIMFGLDIDMMSQGLSYFRKNIWLRALRKNIKLWRKKYISITGYLGDTTYIRIHANTLSGSSDPLVTIVSKRKMDRDNAKKLAQLQAFYPLEQADPNTPPVVNKAFKRDMYRLRGFDRDQIISYCPYDAHEEHSIKIMNVINTDTMPPEGTIFLPGLDLQTLFFYVSKAIDNKTKSIVMMILSQIMIEEGIQQPITQNASMAGLQNSMASQMVSNNLSQNNRGATQQQPVL